MALAAVINKETYDGLDEAIKSEYKSGTDELDGKFVLDVTPVNGMFLENISGLRSSLEKERGNVKSLNIKLKSFDGLDATKAREALKKLEELGDVSKLTSDEKVQQKIDSIKKQLEENHTKAIGEKEGTIKNLLSQLEKLMVDAVAIKALANAKGNADLLLPHIRANTRIVQNSKGEYTVEIVNAEGNTRISPQGANNMTVAELVDEFKAKYPQAFEGSGARGSGASGSADVKVKDGAHVISQADAKNPKKYRAAKEAAEKAGSQLQIEES